MIKLFSSKTSKVLLLGYIIFAFLFVVLWTTERGDNKRQLLLIDSMSNSIEKMRVVSDLIEAARSRVKMLHEILQEDDVFEKDLMYQELSLLGIKFIKGRNSLKELYLLADEQAILDPQEIIYPKIRIKVDQVRSLSLQDDEESIQKAREIVIYEVAPLQGEIIDSFMNLLTKIEEDAKIYEIKANAKHKKSVAYRNTILILIFLVSLIVFFWVLRRIISSEEELHKLSTTDGLTGISNRRCFDQRLSMELKRGKRTKKPISLLLIDIDYFKKYNDTYGHQIGDDCLKNIATEINNIAHRATDFAARYGGEEFVIILTNTDEAGAKLIANQLIGNIRALKIPHTASEIESFVTISIGIATTSPSKDIEPSQLIKAADSALYSAKEGGRNRCVLFKE